MVVIRSTKLSGIAQEQTSEEILAAVRSLNRIAFVQSVASNDWLFNHTLNRIPLTEVTDLVGNVLPFVEVTKTDTSVRVQAVQPITGIVYLF